MVKENHFEKVAARQHGGKKTASEIERPANGMEAKSDLSNNPHAENNIVEKGAKCTRGHRLCTRTTSTVAYACMYNNDFTHSLSLHDLFMDSENRHHGA